MILEFVVKFFDKFKVRFEVVKWFKIVVEVLYVGVDFVKLVF